MNEDAVCLSEGINYIFEAFLFCFLTDSSFSVFLFNASLFNPFYVRRFLHIPSDRCLSDPILECGPDKYHTGNLLCICRILRVRYR